MAINYPGPYEIRIIYTVTISSIAITHVQRLNCDVAGTPDPGTPPDEVLITRRIASLDPADDMMDAVVDEWITLIREIYNTTGTQFVRAELWKFDEESFDGVFVTSYDVGVGGNSASATQGASQTIYTFRTIEGGIMRLSFMETIHAPIAASPLSGLTGATGAIRDFIIGDTNWVLARDTSYPFASMNWSPGQNEAVFKKRYRLLS